MWQFAKLDVLLSRNSLEIKSRCSSVSYFWVWIRSAVRCCGLWKLPGCLGWHTFGNLIDGRGQYLSRGRAYWWSHLWKRGCCKIDRATVDQLFNLVGLLQGSWEFAPPVCMCFVYLERAHDRGPGQFCGGTVGLWDTLTIVTSHLTPEWPKWELCLYSCQKVKHIIHQGCPLSLILFVYSMDRIPRHHGRKESIQTGELRNKSLPFVDEVVLLASSVGVKSSVQQLAWESALPDLRLWFPAWNQWTVSSGFGTSYWFRWGSLCISKFGT